MHGEENGEPFDSWHRRICMKMMSRIKPGQQIASPPYSDRPNI